MQSHAWMEKEGTKINFTKLWIIKNAIKWTKIYCVVCDTHITHTGICDGICETNLTCFRHAKVSKRNSRENTRKTYKESVAAYAEQRKHTNKTQYRQPKFRMSKVFVVITMAHVYIGIANNIPYVTQHTALSSRSITGRNHTFGLIFTATTHNTHANTQSHLVRLAHRVLLLLLFILSYSRSLSRSLTSESLHC